MKIGYVRVSTVEQNEARQMELMKELNIEKVFIDKCSGKDTNRPEFIKMMEFIDNFSKFNDELPEVTKQKLILHIESFSRLARSTKDLLDIVEELQTKSVELVSKKESIDTTTATGRLMLKMISAINDFERENLLERQKEGIAIAKENGVYKGRKKIEFPAEWVEVYNQYKTRQLKANQAMEQLELKRNTFYNLIDEYENQEQG